MADLKVYLLVDMMVVLKDASLAGKTENL